MQSTEIYDKLSQVMRKVFQDDTLTASAEMTAEQVPGWDSMGHIRFIVAVERTFVVKFSSQDISSFDNVGQLTAKIAEKLAQKTA